MTPIFWSIASTRPLALERQTNATGAHFGPAADLGSLAGRISGDRGCLTSVFTEAVTLLELKTTPGSTGYLLIRGQGRLEGYIQLGQTEIPAIVIDRPKEDLLLMSLAENMGEADSIGGLSSAGNWQPQRTR